jgi:hypothetical protein
MIDEDATFYAILRSIPDKLGGVVAMISAILVLLLLPVINTSKIRSSKFRPIFRFLYWFWVADFLILGWIGQKPVESPFIETANFVTFFYFAYFMVFIPFAGYFENISIMDIAKLVTKYIPSEIVVTASNDPRSYRINSDKLLATGYKPKKTVEDAIREIIEQYRIGMLKDDDHFYNLRWMEKTVLAKEI